MNKSKFAIITLALFLFCAIANIQLLEVTSNPATQDITVGSLQFSSSLPTAVATWEIYGWGCSYDICDRRSGFMCYWDSWNGFRPCP
jgi:hypothetical protein